MLYLSTCAGLKNSAPGRIKLGGIPLACKDPSDAAWDERLAGIRRRLESGDPGTRQVAVRSLRNIGDGQAIELLISCLRDDYDRVRWDAADALLAIGEPVVEPLLRVLEEGENKYARAEAAGVLGRMKDGRVIDSLIECFRDDDGNVRWIARKALIVMGEPAAKPLIETLDDPHIRIRKRALKALIQIGKPAVGPLTAALDDDRLRVRQGSLEALEMIGEPAVLSLLKTLETGSPRSRWRAAEALGRLGDIRAVAPLIRALHDCTLDVRWKATESLGMIGDKRSMEALIEALCDSEKYVRQGAARSLGKIGDERALAPLARVARDDGDGDVRETAARASRRIKFSIDFSSDK